MLFNTLEYARFFVPVFVISWLLIRWPKARQVFLLIASYGFYAGWKWQYLPLIFASSTVDYWLGQSIAKESRPARRKLWLAVTVLVNLSFLGLFKYWDFGVSSLQTLGGWLGLQVPPVFLHLMLPVGISFYTFESMSYVIDVYRGTTRPCDSYLKYLLFVAFFPKLVAGPIIRPRDLIPQFERAPRWSDGQGAQALFLIALGLLKKVVIGDYLALNLVDRVFLQPSGYSALEVLAGIYGYAVQIYCDFSGYSDIAIGSAALLGVQFSRNFNSPYKAHNLQEFWHRWHISLSSWLRDYLYIPLGGSRGGPLRTYRNLLLTMLLGGLWHGAAWTFVFWGLMHGLGLALTRLWQHSRWASSEETSGWGRLIGALLTFQYVCVAWVFFRADSFAKAWAVLARLGSLTTHHQNLPQGVLLALGAGLVTHFLPVNLYEKARTSFVALPSWAQGFVLFAVAFVLREVASAQAVPFLYFQF